MNTVCQEAACPNRRECFEDKTATFLIMGPSCTRDCRFCVVNSATPEPLDQTEPKRVAFAARSLNLVYVVITSVTRDDLADGGASHFVNTIRAVEAAIPGSHIEILIPDFRGDPESVSMVAAAQPYCIGHNVETIERLYPEVRPQADYRRSLEVLRKVKRRDPAILTKSGIMVGLGEAKEEIVETLADIRDTGCDIVTIGQYLQPSKRQPPVYRYYSPDEFARLQVEARNLGFIDVESGPFVRSSYHAGVLVR